ncbi:hypothetical protein NM208_g13865 [Fusarium decemcellulare]|uniref:Uncharacterized protein n=1 Tax=Fusarium decemcellulare TaxID=57161 RepID=A0ACC1RI84_9HYPO|nr:hypothetical protein NM208_g13865 [Fusarium decemcellulare]
MKPQNIFLTQTLLASIPALALPADSGSKSSEKSTITWKPCELDLNYVGVAKGQKAYECARLTVPLDYTDESNGDIKLDLIRVKASKKPSKGSILYNPGGPGGSGVDQIAILGQRFLDFTGGHYDIIGFDPRGTGRTIPFTCNTTRLGPLARRDVSLPETDIWDFLKGEYWKKEAKRAEACYRDQKKYGPYVGTTFVARDMLSIVDALGQGDKLNYWGVSYGTILGQVFISMFPDRVGRIVLDSSLSADAYVTGSWLGSNSDAEKALGNFFDECVKGGPEYCSLSNSTGKDTTGRDLLKAFDDAMDGLVGETEPEEFGGGNMTISFVKQRLVSSLMGQFDMGVQIVEAALKGNWTAAVLGPGSPASTNTSALWNKGTHAQEGISCIDSSFRAQDAEDYYSNYRAHISQGSLSDTTLYQGLICSQWKFSAAEKVDTNKLRNIKTSSPVLLLNGIYDPVTPLSDAWEVSARLRGSRLIIHEGAGHGAITQPSNCTEEAVGRYFTDGELPKSGTVCKPNLPFFESFEHEMKRFSEIAAEAAKNNGDGGDE